jgi:hypothetical protein
MAEVWMERCMAGGGGKEVYDSRMRWRWTGGGDDV